MTDLHYGACQSNAQLLLLRMSLPDMRLVEDAYDDSCDSVCERGLSKRPRTSLHLLTQQLLLTGLDNVLCSRGKHNKVLSTFCAQVH